MSPGVHHHLGALVRGEVRVMQVPVGVSSPAEDVKAIMVGVVAGNTNAREPRFRDTQHIIIHIRGQPHMHSKVAVPHVDH